MNDVARIRFSDRLLLYLWIPLSVGPMFWGLGDLGGIQLHHGAILLIYGYALILSCARGSLARINKFLIVLLAYILLTGVALNGWSLDFWLKYFSYIGVIVVANHVAKTMPLKTFVLHVSGVLKMMLAISLVLAVVLPFIAFHVVDGQNSLNGVYVQKNTFGRLIYFLIFFISLQLVAGWKRPVARDLMWVILCSIGLILSNSRTSQAMALILGLVPFAFKYSYIRLSIVPILLALVVLTIIGFASGEVYFGDLGTSRDYVTILGLDVPLTGRATIWQGALDGLNKEGRWLFGFGLEGFYGSSFRSYVSNIGLGVFVPADSHNGYIDLILNFGIVGALIFFIIGFKIYSNASRYPVGGEKIAILSFLVLYLASNITESFFVKTSNITSFMLLVMFLYSYGFRDHVARNIRDASAV